MCEYCCTTLLNIKNTVAIGKRIVLSVVVILEMLVTSRLKQIDTKLSKKFNTMVVKKSENNYYELVSAIL